MIPEQIPVNNHYGNNSATVFDFDFYIENKSQIVVTHTAIDGTVTYPVLGVDYDIVAVGNQNGSQVTFPLSGSSYSILAWDTETDEKELLTIALTLPVVQEAKYNKSGELNKENLEYSLDYLTRLIQILYRILTRTLQLPEGSGQSMQEFVEDLKTGNEQAISIASSAETKADNAISIANTAEAKADNAVSIASNAVTTANNAADVANTALTNSALAINTSESANQNANYASDKVDEFGEDIEAVLEAADMIDELRGDIATIRGQVQDAINAANAAQEAADHLHIDDVLSDESEQPVQNKVIKSALDDKQETLVSGENIKTLNGTSLLGDEDITLADPDLSNLSQTGENKFDAKVNKSGDTMTGNLTIARDASNPAVMLKNTAHKRSTNPSSDAGIAYLIFKDKDNDDFGNVGIERYTNGRNTIKLQVFSKDGSQSPALRINAYADNTSDCTFPKTLCCDGQWTYLGQDILSGASLTNASNADVAKTVNVPNDGRIYEILVRGRVTTGTTSGNLIRLQFTTNSCGGSVFVCSAITRAAATNGSQGTVTAYIKGGSNNMNIARASNFTGTADLHVIAYRRVGTNT